MENNAMSSLGSIVIKVWRVQIVGAKPKALPKRVSSVRPPKERKINETAKKALLTHSVKYVHLL
jgi:hypothetical protein